MLKLLKRIKQYCPWIWNLIESCNGLMIMIFYGKRLNDTIEDALVVGFDSPYVYRRLELRDANKLMHLINNQPEGFDDYFKPHPFDVKTFRRVLSNGTYVLLGVFDNGILVGYSFMRLFINKTAFRGKIVDYRYQGRGIAKKMGQIMINIAADMGFRVYATISKANVASMQSAKSGAQIRVIKELPDNYLYIEILKDKNYDS